ncbi:hypothetical protein DYB37_008435 [Aphanomyces astaci]|uniref:Uncharacterized protein n=1 Tax=Aphanomyces astaci TaxID=112090 RepID=A0A3L6VA50_APHAT|nr:hypothetical protein DYB35_001278 [Aphanomyces astaci]RHZ03333.1 hypothetical protein DYB37_008435 [Aphanomyces astaci]RLO05761.1 hypothetical protein DYB28_004906 [Aphanomyces astaci]
MVHTFQGLLEKPMSAPEAIQLVATQLYGRRRMGAWSQAEIDYAYHMSRAFKEGLFDGGIPEGESVRLWLARLLNCSPMRLSKKFDRESKLLGMCFFAKKQVALDAMSPQERQDRYDAMESARLRFMKSLGSERYHQHVQPTFALRQQKRAAVERTPVQTVKQETSKMDEVVTCRESLDLYSIDMVEFDRWLSEFDDTALKYELRELEIVV